MAMAAVHLSQLFRFSGPALTCHGFVRFHCLLDMMMVIRMIMDPNV